MVDACLIPTGNRSSFNGANLISDDRQESEERAESGTIKESSGRRGRETLPVIFTAGKDLRGH